MSDAANLPGAASPQTPSAATIPAAGGGDARIVVAGLGKHYGSLHVFNDINISVGKEEIVSILGPSGCGKTTLLRCIDGLLSYDAGEVRIGERVVKQPLPGVAMVFQHFGLFPWKTVFKNVAYGMELAGASRADVREKVPYYIDLVGLKGFEDRYPYELSGGMQQRCGFARAMATEPDVLLMDEPFGAIDAQTREILQFELLRIWRMRKTSMVFVTHSIEEAVLMGDRVIILKGRPSSVSDVIDIDLERPRSRETLLQPRFSELREQVWATLVDDVKRAEFVLNSA
ncbi:MAG: ABC transporter ATP-binding protein [Beijerinckiaceae bacterium]